MNYLRSSCFRKLTKQTKDIKKFQKLVIRCCHSAESLFSYGEDVNAAKEKGLPIVALESTIITHGMPYPENLTTALEVEDIIRKKGVVPATIAILDGKIKVGATQLEIERLAKSKGQNVIKVSRRDFSYAISQGLSGGTTVSGTMLVASKAGIPIMATGGIGGVHRQAELSMDISADLKELGQTPIAVVCSGVKAILDIPKTLEYLETEGVPVATLGPTNAFPAFYSRQTFNGLQSPLRLPDAESASRLIAAQTRLGLGTGVLLAVPIPEPYGLDPREIEVAIEQALQAANDKNIRGKSVTPFLLGELSRLTAGRSLQSNIALIKNNAGVAADIALHLAGIQGSVSSSSAASDHFSDAKRNPVVIGGATFDTILRVKEPEIKMNGRTHNGESRRSCGGVGRNLTAALVNLGMTDTKLLSTIGDDEAGKAVIDSLGKAASTIRILPDIVTARYTAVVDRNGNCCFGIGEMEAFMEINQKYIEENTAIFKDIPFLVIDGNPSFDAMKTALDIALKNQIPVWYEPTDLKKAFKIFECRSPWQNVVYFASPNVNELVAIAEHFKIPIPSNMSKVDLDSIKKITEELNQWIPVIITTLGEMGLLVTRKASANEPFLNKNNKLIENGETQSHLYAPLNVHEDIVSVSGCGDCLAAGIITGILRGWKESSCISLGLHAARESLISYETVPSSLKSLPVIQDFYKSDV